MFLISDFIDTGYEHNLKALARKHDLIVIHIYDQRETNLPRLGIIPIYDAEKHAQVWVNTSSPDYRSDMWGRFQRRREMLERLCRQNKADYLSLDAGEDYVPALVRLFRVRRYVYNGGRS